MGFADRLANHLRASKARQGEGIWFRAYGQWSWELWRSHCRPQRQSTAKDAVFADVVGDVVAAVSIGVAALPVVA